MSDMHTLPVVIGSDHAGFALKGAIVDHLTALGKEVVDVGTDAAERCDYPDFAHAVADKVAAGTHAGILVCGSGMGVSIAANRHKGVRAVNCTFESQAVLSRAHNDANVLCLGQRVVAPDLGKAIVDAFLSSPFEGGRHEGRVAKIEL